MAVSDSAKIDLLYKKLFGVAKTDTPANKSPSNESIASPAFIRGDIIWQQSLNIPAIASAVGGIVQDYTGANCVQCTADTTTSPIGSVYPSWKTNLTDWIPSELGSTYFIKVFVDNAGAGNATSTGTQIFDSGSGGTGEWNFDYQSGVLNFIGGTIPAVLTAAKVIYVAGYRYIGTKGLANIAATSFTGNLNGTATTSNVSLYDSVTATTTNASFYPVFTDRSTTGNSASFVSGYLSYNPNTGTISSTTFAGNVFTSNIQSSNGAITVSSGANVVLFNSNAAVKLPIGTNTNRPSGVTGYLRFNTDVNTVEYHNGTSWVPVVNTVTDQQITGDGVNATFTLDQISSTVGVLVSINGTLQQPTISYTVSGNQITFTEVPLVSDVIDVRFLGSTATLSSTLNDNLTVTGNITLSGILSQPLTTKANTAPGSAGQVAWDGNYIYVCVATNTWKRVALSSF